jgi:hypothetical protein
MPICHPIKSLRIAVSPLTLILLAIPAVITARAQAPSPAAVQLQPYTAPDQSASAGVPSGWQVTNAGSGAIAMAGPQGEAVNVKVIVAHDGPFHLGQRGPSGADLTMPSSAKLSDKLVMVLEQQAALNGMPVPQLKYLYQAPIKMPSGMGQCGMFAVSAAGGPNPADAMGIFCSLGDSSANFFKTFLMYGAAPTTIAAQTVPTVEAVFKSYKLAPGWTQKILSPYTPADATDPGPGGSGYPGNANANTNNGPGAGGGYNPGPGGSAGYPIPPTANSANSSKTALDDGPGLGGGYNPGPGGSAGYPYNGTDPDLSYSALLWRNQQAIDHGFICVDANITGNGSPSQTPVECGGWKPNF